LSSFFRAPQAGLYQDRDNRVVPYLALDLHRNDLSRESHIPDSPIVGIHPRDALVFRQFRQFVIDPTGKGVVVMVLPVWYVDE
jgi:hypothetical protein